MRKVLRFFANHWRAVFLYALLLAGGWFMADLLRQIAIPEMRPMNEPIIHRMLMGAIVLFVITAAIPFVPGAEIGFALLLLFGAPAAPLVYFSMVGALLLSFTIARCFPPHRVAKGLERLRLHRASQLVRDMAELPASARADHLMSRLPGTVPAYLVGHRYLALAVLFNLPGNSLLGGGGGIAFIAGLSGVFGLGRYILTVAIAVAPVPLLFLIS